MTTKCTASIYPPPDIQYWKSWQEINNSLEWAAMYQESMGLKNAAAKTRNLIVLHDELIAKGILK